MKFHNEWIREEINKKEILSHSSIVNGSDEAQIKTMILLCGFSHIHSCYYKCTNVFLYKDFVKFQKDVMLMYEFKIAEKIICTY